MEQPRLIVIRTRASAQIGSGHIRRMAILARYLRALAYQVVLVCNPGARSVFPPADTAFDRIIEVADEASSLAACAALQDPIAAIFFDDYAMDAADHAPYRALTPLLAGIDDMANRALDWDVLFDMNIGRSAADYAGFVTAQTHGFYGADFQIIQPAFFELQAQSVARDRWPLARVFVSLGGTDPFDLTAPVVAAAYDTLPHCAIDVVAGSMSPHFASLETYIATLDPRVTLHADAQNVPQLMAAADLAIGAGGTMTWERNALGLPSVLLVIADNQQQVGDAMRDAKAAIVVDVRGGYSETPLKDALMQVSADPDLSAQLSRNARQLSGTNGAENIAKHLNIQIMTSVEQG